MGALSDVRTSETTLLEAENFIGRSTRCGIKLSSAVASSVHASIRWTPRGWELKDLSSTNGSFLNGQRLEAGRPRILTKGDVVAFGSSEFGWRLVDDLPPTPVVVSEDGERVSGVDLIAVPSSEAPRATLFRADDGAWHIEQVGGTAQIENGGGFEVCGKSWRFFVPVAVTQTESLRYDVRTAVLEFRVSSDEDHVSLRARVQGDIVDLGARANNYLLLTLARRRLEDERAGREDAAQGWVHQEELVEDLHADPEHINVDIFRLRKRFERFFRNAVHVVERRAGTGQLRLGIRGIEIHRI